MHVGCSIFVMEAQSQKPAQRGPFLTFSILHNMSWEPGDDIFDILLMDLCGSEWYLMIFCTKISALASMVFDERKNKISLARRPILSRLRIPENNIFR